MEQSFRRVVPLMNELSSLGREEGSRYQQLLWALQGECRKAPEFPHCAVAMAQALGLSGEVADARQELRQLLDRLKGQGLELPTMLAVHMVYEAAHLGMIEECRPFLTFLLNLENINHPELAGLIFPGAYKTAARCGDVELLQRCAQLPLHDAGKAKLLLQLLEEADLLSSFSRQQRAVEEVLGPITSRFQADILRVDGGGLRVVMLYHTNTACERWMGLYDEIQAAMREVHASHVNGPAASLGRVIIRIAGPCIPVAKKEGMLT